MVRFPRAEDAEGSTIRIEGPGDVVDKIIAQINDMVNTRDSYTTESLQVPSEKHRLLIGRGGEIRRNLESQFNISLDIPKQTVTGAARENVKITGQPDDIAKAKAHIASITKDQEAATIAVPLKYHHTVSDNGQLFRRLRNDHKVTVDHAGKRPPPKPAAPTPKRNAPASSAALPLITDDSADSADSHSFDMHALYADAPDGDIPWVLSGPSTSELEAARKKIETAVAEAGKSDTAGFLILGDPRLYRLVVGPGGAEINRIRKATGTRINVPGGRGKGGSGGDGGEAIEILGGREGVEMARDEILKTVRGTGRG